MNNNKSAFDSQEYDMKIKQTLPYYDAFYEQVIGLVKVCNHNALRWLDVGCGTGKMAEIVFENIEVEQFTFCDCSAEMLEIATQRFPYPNAEFIMCEAQKLPYMNEFDIVTAIQVNHYLQKEERRVALKKCYDALKENGLFISFDNFVPFSELGKKVSLDRWKDYQIQQGKTPVECEKHMNRYGKAYFPVSLTEHLELMRCCGFRVVEVLWISNMQVGIWGMK